MTQGSLTLSGVSSGYGASVVLRDLSLTLPAGTVLALLGKNGMGKTTLLKTIMGYLPKQAGSIALHGADITRLAPHRIAHAGVAYAAQEHALFQDLSIRDNLALGLAHDKLFDARFPAVAEIFPFLRDRLRQFAGTLSGGEQKMLLVARALMARPALILLDEITEGLQPSVIDRLADALLRERAQHGTTMLVVEQNVSFALRLAERYALMKQGRIVAQGDSNAPEATHTILEHLRI